MGRVEARVESVEASAYAIPTDAPESDGLLEIDADRRLARVQPGVVLDHLNRRAARHGLAFGPDPARAVTTGRAARARTRA